MSLKAVTWALEQPITDSIAKLILIGLCDAHNNATGRCFPSKKELAAAAVCDERTVSRKLQWLVDEGWITVTARFDETGRQTSNEYIVNLSAGEGDSVSRGGDSLSRGGDTPVMGEGDTAVTPYEREERTGNTTLSGAEALSSALCEAAGFTDETKHPNLIVLSEPFRWLETGCDLEKDILPAIRSTAAAAKARGTKITSWGYFNDPVFEARDRRLAPAPDVVPRSKPKQRESTMDKIKRLQAEGRINA